MELDRAIKELNDYKTQKRFALDTSQAIIQVLFNISNLQEIKKDNERLIQVIDDKNGDIEL